MVLDNLIFFNEKGFEIPVLKIYTLQWEIIPNDQVQHNFIRNPKGHFMIDLNGNISIIIDDKGLINLYSVDLYNSRNEYTGITISDINDICLLNKEIQYTKYNRYTGSSIVTETIQNTVLLTINTLNDTITETAPIDIFVNHLNSIQFSTEQVIDEDGNISHEYYLLEKLTLTKDDDNKTFVDYLIESIFTNVDNIYPCVRYIGSCIQDKVSTDFVSASTVVILQEQILPDGNITYINPIVNNNISLLFEFQKNSEMRFISSNTVADIIWESSYTANRTNQKDKETPLYFSVGFTTSIEGCYQNILGMYILGKDNKRYLAGLITFLTEVEGEDERYRALLGNLGIPDPIKYPNIFKSQDHLEECVDWTLINKKSKELMLNYENIFPYAGTYKALLNAVKFLGYFDLIFKEWYKIKDLNNRDKFVTLQTYDTITGKSLKSKLKNIGVDFGEFERYKKLNRLTMVYHLEQIDESNTYETLNVYGKDNTTNEIISKSILFDIPLIKKIYEYRTDEILAKLYSVKVWLENNILGVNCYIADICGEGIVIERMKTQAYVTEHYVKDYYSDAYITPKITDIDNFVNSSTNITCSLNEYNSVTFETYIDTPISAFIKYEKPKTYLTYSDMPVYISNPIGALIKADELQYELHTINCSCGSLYEFMTSNNTDNPILIKDNKIVLFDNNKNTTLIDNTESPIIEISQANIRYTHGNWKSNIKYSINIIEKDNSQYYTIQTYNTETGLFNSIYEGIRQIMLYPENNTSFIYTSDNQWNVPMIIIRNYTSDNLDLTGDFILEIIKGKLIFRNKQSEIINGTCTGAEVLFGYEDLTFDGIEQSILVNYSYIDERFPVFTYSDIDAYNYISNANKIVNSYNSHIYTSISNDNIIKQQDNSYFAKLAEQNKKNLSKSLYYNNIDKAVIYNSKRNIKVNRLGQYTVTAKAYDEYNRIYVNKSNNIYTVYAPSVDIECYLNSDKIINKKSFNDSTYFGKKLEVSDTSILLDNINENNTYPKYPQSYRIYDIDTKLDLNDIIEYDNISYALDIPEEHDYITFNNFTERVIKISIEDNIKLLLCDGNPNPDTLTYAHEIGLCIYDNIKKEIIYDIFPLTVSENGLYISDDIINTSYNSSNSYILCDNNIEIPTEYCNVDLNNHINAYVYNVTSLLLHTSDISVNYDNNETIINNVDNQFYKAEDIIKLSYVKTSEGPNVFTNFNSIYNEATYRIKDIIIQDNELYTYIIDGIFDLYKLDNKIINNITTHNASLITKDNTAYMTYDPIRIVISPAHLSAALYTLRAVENGLELVYSYNNAAIQRTLVKYEGSPLLFDSYLDTNYSAIILKFNPKVLHDMWCYNINYYLNKNDNIYKYVNIPITIDKGRNIIIKYDENQNVLDSSICELNVQWDWSSYLIEEIPNATLSENYVDKHLLFQAKNNILVLNPNILGPLNIGLTLIDIYGNRINNHGEGLLYVQDTDKIYVKRSIDEKLDIKQELKSIIAITPFDSGISENTDNILYGGSSKSNLIDVIAADGETATVYLNNSDVSLPKSGNLYSIDVPYAIYYNDGSVSYNKGAILTLTDEDGNPIKGNKDKVKFKKANSSHKHICKKYKVNIFAGYNMDNDLINSCSVTIPIMQYGYNKTIKIYDLLFLLSDVERSGVEQINNEILSSMIHSVSYKMERTDGTIEDIYGETLEDVNLKISAYKFIGRKGIMNNISENETGYRRKIGILQVNVQFYVHGVTDNIETSYICSVYQL